MIDVFSGGNSPDSETVKPGQWKNQVEESLHSSMNTGFSGMT